MDGLTPGLADRAKLEAALLSRARRRDPIPVLPRAGAVFVTPAAPSQEGMWAEAHDEAEAAPIILCGVRLRGHLDIGALRRALSVLVARHESLRTTFQRRDGDLVQVIGPAAEPEIPLSRISAGNFAEAAAADVEQPFDLERGPLYRLRLLELSSDDVIAMLILHHIIGDARAVEVFLTELVTCYVADRRGTEPDLPGLPIQYGDFAMWYRERLAGPRGQELISYWVGRLEGAVPLLLPADLAPASRHSPRGDTQRVPIPAELIGAAADMARRNRATLHMVTCAAFQILMARLTGQRDIAVRVPISYRSRREVENLIADFSNDIVFRTDLSGNPTFTEVLAQVRDAAALDFAHNELPPHLLAPWLPEPGLLGQLFQVQFSTESDPRIDLPLADLRAQSMPPPWGYAFRPLALRVRLTPDGADCIVTYRTAVFSAGRITDLINDYLAELAELTAYPGRPVFGEHGRSARPELRVPCAAAGPARVSPGIARPAAPRPSARQ